METLVLRILVCWVLLLCGVCSASASDNAHFSITTQELDTLGMEISDKEKAAIIEAIALGQEISRVAEKVNGKPYRRDAHAKATGCVRATFSINSDIPGRFRHSIFATPGREYQAWIRFSNGDMTVQADKKPDARGMAIKVVGIEGEKIAPELAGARTQDFIMTNTPAFFHHNVFDYVEDMRYLAKLERTKWFINLWPPRLHPLRFYRAIQTVSATIDTPLEPQYYSMIPYGLGESQLKFSAKPCAKSNYEPKESRSDDNYLTEAMENQLQSDNACFDFMVQEKIPGKRMPIDNAVVIWSEKKSPFIPIAKVTIPAQTFTSEKQQTFCENLSMNPWHGVGDWEPLGSLNRARRLVYHAVSHYRHTKNSAQNIEPKNWCLNGEDSCDLTDIFLTDIDN